MSDTTLSKEEKQYKRLTGEPVARLVLELGLPTTISMLITNLYNMVAVSYTHLTLPTIA